MGRRRGREKRIREGREGAERGENRKGRELRWNRKGRSERGRGIEREGEGREGARQRKMDRGESPATCLLTAMSLLRGCQKCKLDCVE